MTPAVPPPTADDVAAFERDGYVVVRGFLDATATAGLRAAIEDADAADDNELTLSTMRFESNLYRHSAAIRRFLASDAVVGLVTTLLGPDVWLRWDQAVWKGPDGPVFPWHQDNGYSGLDDMHLQLWIALSRLRPENGGLLVAPGAHRTLLDHRWVGNHVETDLPGRIVEVDAEPGDAVVFSSFLPHSTTPNRTGDDRLAYIAEFLPIGAPDRAIESPHFVVARDGRPDPTFVDLSDGWSTAP